MWLRIWPDTCIKVAIWFCFITQRQAANPTDKLAEPCNIFSRKVHLENELCGILWRSDIHFDSFGSVHKICHYPHSEKVCVNYSLYRCKQSWKRSMEGWGGMSYASSVQEKLVREILRKLRLVSILLLCQPVRLVSTYLHGIWACFLDAHPILE